MNKAVTNESNKPGRQTVIKLPGSDFDYSLSIQFKSTFNNIIKRNINSSVILDCSNINLIDETGLATIMFAWRVCSKQKVKFILCNLNNISTSLLLKKGIDKLIDITNSLNEAISLSQYYTRYRHIAFNNSSFNNVFGNIYS